ncbi:Sugar transporter [Sphingobium faniae]|nr:Sugar transporter [Sphingobium faniae]
MRHDATQSSAIARRMDALPFNRLHMLLCVILGLGLMFDQMEASMTSVLMALFSEPDTHVSRQALSRMLVAYYAVAAIGAPVMGMVADRFGRRIALVGTLFGFGLLTFASVLMPDFTGFALCRIASSFALSAVPPLVFSYIADTLPPTIRGVVMMLISLLAGLGAALAPLATHWGNDMRPGGFEGWQTAMLVGSFAGIALGAAMFLLPESPRWLSARARRERAEQAMQRFEASAPLRQRPSPPPATHRNESPASIVQPPPQQATIGAYRGRLLLVTIILFLQSSGLTGFALLLTKALIMKGMSMQTALAYSSLILLAMPVGVIASAFVTDRMARRTLFMTLAVVLAISATAFGIVQSEFWLITAGLVFSFFMTAHASVGQIYCAEMFPTAIRGTTMGFGYAAVRIGSACVPVLILPLLLDKGPATAFMVIGAFLLSAGLIARLFGPAIMPRASLD